MALSTLISAASSYANGRRSLCQLEIRPDAEFILFRGDPGTTGPVKLKGRLVLMTAEKLELKGLRVVFEGKRKTIKHMQAPGVDPRLSKARTPPILNKTRFLRTQLDIKDTHGNDIKTVLAGNHEWPFEIELPGDMPESIEGMESFIMYNIRATGDRGVWAKDLEAERHIRVIRTLSEGSMECVDSHSIPGVWPDKVKYNFFIPSKAVIFGTSLSADVELTPLLEKVTFAKIKVLVHEIIKIKTIPGPHESHPENSHGMWRTEKVVVSKEIPITDTLNATDAETLLPMKKIKIRAPLPKSLNDCRQDVHHNDWFQIKHHVFYEVTINNPEGHQSMLRGNHELKLFISPNLPIDEHNEVPDVTSNRAVRDSTLLGELQAAPPLYETHRLDRLYEDVDMSGYITPGPWSGAQTPLVASSFSRSGSSDNLGSLATAAAALHQQQAQAQAQNNEPLAAALEHRLANLQVNGVEHRHSQTHGHGPSQIHPGSNAGSPGEETDAGAHITEYFEQSSRARVRPQDAHSPEEAQQVQHIEYDMAALERITSYGTAVRSQPVSSFAEEPPDYGHATASSRPPPPS